MLGGKKIVAGSVYNWSKRLGSRIVGWSSGWLMLTASIVTLSAVALALALPPLLIGIIAKTKALFAVLHAL
jgi:amino acid transporter